MLATSRGLPRQTKYRPQEPDIANPGTEELHLIKSKMSKGLIFHVEFNGKQVWLRKLAIYCGKLA